MMLAIEMIVNNEMAKRIEENSSTLVRLNRFKPPLGATTVFVITFF
jgi:hypothetical protein